VVQVGLRVNVTMGATTIKDIREGTSAADSMLRVGDVIAEVDGEDIEMFGAAKVWALLKGPAPARAAAGRVLTPRECQVLNVPIGE
jgi:C-terminal processing protease CtpA/Prc